MKMSDCVAVVTGGASGLGEATVRNFVSCGGKAAILDLQEERGQALAAELGASTTFIRTDVTSADDVASALDQASAALGPINVAVNCAGIVNPGKVVGRSGPLALDAYELVIRVNLVGTFNVTRLAAAKMVANEPNQEGERGLIVNTASVAAYEGQIGQAAYGSSKAGVVGLTLPAARELAASGVRVMSIAPGLFETPMFDAIPEKAREALSAMTPFPSRLGRPEEYARLVQAIVEIPMLNGSTIRVDGAIRMKEK